MQRFVIGLSAGPSVTGVDAALLQVRGEGLELGVEIAGWHTEPYTSELRQLVVQASTPEQADVRKIAVAHRLLGETLAAAARQAANQASRSLQSVLCIGLSGHVAWHEGEGRYPATLELGLPAIVAERTGVTVVNDFRARDLAAGGQGSPLGVRCDEILFRRPDETRLIIHLGGLTSATLLPAARSARHAVGWELGPGAVLLDALVQQLTNGKERFDAGGKHAVQGRQLPELLALWGNHPFLARRPPRSTHRHLFAESFARHTVSMALQKSWDSRDLLCTATHFVIRAVADGLRRLLPAQPKVDRLLASGGGVKNGLLLRLLQECFPGVPVDRIDEHGVPVDARSAVHAGLLACLALDHTPGNVPAVTGAAGERLLGTFTPGAARNWNACLAWLTGQRRELAEDPGIIE